MFFSQEKSLNCFRSKLTLPEYVVVAGKTVRFRTSIEEDGREIWESSRAARGRCREFLYYSYANLVTAHHAVKCRDGKYKKTAYMIRTKRDCWMEL